MDINIMYTPQSKTELKELQSTMYLFAPDSFLILSNERPGEGRTLASTVAELRRGIDHVYRKSRHDEARVVMHALVDKMYAQFEAGQESEGRATSLEFREFLTQTRP